MCRCSYLILGILRARNASDKIHGLTINEICELEKQSKPNTIHKHIKNMEIMGFICEGVKAGKAKTYFLTTKGINELPEKTKSENKNIDERDE